MGLMTKHYFGVAATASLLLSLVAGSVSAQGKNVTLQGIQSATVAPSGLAFASVAGTSFNTQEQRVEDGADLSGVFGFGTGNAETSIGFQFSANITSIFENFGNSGYITFKASQRLAEHETPTYVGVVIDHLGQWGDYAEDYEPTVAFAMTSFPDVSIGSEMFPLMLTIGAGSHVRDGGTEPGIFLGAGIGLTQNLGASIAWTGETVTLGSAFKFDGLENVSFSANVDDVFDQLDSRRITLSATWFTQDLFGG